MLLGITIGMITDSTDHLGGKEKEKKIYRPCHGVPHKGAIEVNAR